MLKGEKFVAIKGFEEQYKISNYGNVMSLATEKCKHCGHQGKKKKFLKMPVLKHGYRAVSLCKRGMGAGRSKGFSVHRLVAEHFVKGQSPEKNIVNHIDGNKLNNRAENLEWVTRSENQKHAYSTGLQKAPKGTVRI